MRVTKTNPLLLILTLKLSSADLFLLNIFFHILSWQPFYFSNKIWWLSSLVWKSLISPQSKLVAKTHLHTICLWKAVTDFKQVHKHDGRTKPWIRVTSVWFPSRQTWSSSREVRVGLRRGWRWLARLPPVLWEAESWSLSLVPNSLLEVDNVPRFCPGCWGYQSNR